jgi:GntR family transcriptional regulator, transcriptional repressor for pyruvate dehydrogenase complex
MTNLVGPNAIGDGRVENVAQRLIEQLRESKDSRRLPSERRLATLLGCSRNTVREALARLRERGLIDVRSRSGAYERPPEPGGGTRSGQALAALELVGPEVTRLVAGAFSESYVDRLEEITSQISRALLKRDSADASRCFVRFYVELGRMAGNTYLQHTLLKIEADGSLTPASAGVPQQRTLEAFFTQHVDVLQALRRGDARRVEKLAQRCIRAFANFMHLKAATVEHPNEVLQ